MRFNQFYKDRVDEKVSKSEMNDSLRNHRIFVGAEFEFISDELASYSYIDPDLKDDYDTALKQYNDFKEKWKEFEDRRNEIHGELVEAQDAVYRLDRYAIPETEDEIEELEDDIDDTKDEIESLQDDIDIERSDGNPDADEVERLYKLKREAEEKINKMKTDLKKKENELKELKLELIRMEAQYEEAEQDMDYIEYPWPGDTYKNYVDNMYNNYGMGESFNEYYFEDGEISFPPEPPDAGLDDEYVWKDAMEDMKDTIFRDFPIDVEINVTGYHESKQEIGDTYWKAEFDSSIADEGGIELVTPPIKLPEFIEICPKIFSWIERNGGTNSYCGFHIHMSVEGIDDLEDQMDPVKLIVMTDEGSIWKHFEGREFNNYVSSKKQTLSQRGVTEDDFNRLINKSKLKRKLVSSHSESINFQSWHEGHVEFRQMGGTNYTRKWSKVKTTLGQFAHNLSISVDDNWKRQEYIARLTRLANKLDNVKYNSLIEYMDGLNGQLEFELKNNKSLSPGDKKDIRTSMKYVNLQKKKYGETMKTSGGLPDSQMSMILKNNRDFMRNIEKYAKGTLTDIVNNTKLVQIPDVFDEIRPYVDINNLKK